MAGLLFLAYVLWSDLMALVKVRRPQPPRGLGFWLNVLYVVIMLFYLLLFLCDFRVMFC